MQTCVGKFVNCYEGCIVYCTMVLLRDTHEFVCSFCALFPSRPRQSSNGVAAVPAPLPLGGAVGGHGVYVPVQLMGGGQTLA